MPTRNALTAPGTGASPFLGTLLIIGYIAIALLPSFLSAVILPPSGFSFIYELGRKAALTGTMLLLLQLVLAGRLKPLAAPYGLDAVVRFHKAMGVLAVVLLLVHPFLLAAGEGGWALLWSTQWSWGVQLGKPALLLLAVLVAISVFRRTPGSFERWRTFHNLVILVAAAGLVHSWVAGGELRYPFMRWLWLAMAVIAAAAYLRHKIWLPWRLKHQAYRVAELRSESPDTWTVVLQPPTGTAVSQYLPGQFHFLTFFRGDRRFDGEEHPFTIASDPARPEEYASTIKASGDFTRTLGQTPVGTAVSVQSAFGRFSYAFYPKDHDLVFMAGGIGITPLVSMLRHLHSRGDRRPVTLIYAARTEMDLVSRSEIEAIAKSGRPDLRIRYILSQAGPGWSGETGTLSVDKLRRWVEGDLRKKAFYVCGPPGMISAAERALHALGVRAGQIRAERFSF